MLFVLRALYPLNESFRIHPCVPDVDDVNNIFNFVILMNDFKTTVHYVATTIYYLSVIEKFLWCVRFWENSYTFFECRDFIFPAHCRRFAIFH